MNWTFCWLPFDNSSARRGSKVGDPEATQPGDRLTPGAVRRLAIERAEVDELVEDAHPRVEAALLGQVAPRPARQVGGRSALPADLARIRPDDAEADPHGRGLARPVRAEEAEDLAAPDVECQGVEGRGRAEPLRDVVDGKAHAAEDSLESRYPPPER